MTNLTLHKTLLETGYMGAFYGIRPQAKAIFEFFQMPHQPSAAQASGLLGSVLLMMGAAQWEESAANALEKFIAQAEKNHQRVPAEVKVFLALTYKKAKKRSDRVEALLEEVLEGTEETGEEAARHAAKLLAEE